MMFRQQVKTIDRYLATHTIWGILFILFLLIILFSFFEFLGQLNDVGKGNYGLADAFVFVGLTVPKRIVDLMALSILLGSIVALGILADRNELIAIQAAGISVQKICRTVVSAGVLVMLATVALAEFVAPPMEQHARIRRSQAIYGKGIMLTKSGFWTRHGHSIIHVGKTISADSAADVDIYEHDQQGRLRRFMHAREAIIVENDQWLLKDIEEKTFSEQGIRAHHRPSQTLDAFLSAEQLSILELPPDSLSLSDLYHYVRGLKERGQNAERYALSLWQKLTLPLTIIVMMLLALTFIFGHSREITTGRRIILASMAGILIYLVNQILGHLGLLLDLHPAFITLAPVFVIFSISFWLLRRIR